MPTSVFAGSNRHLVSTRLISELLLVALAPDLDQRFERLYAYLHDDVSRRRASAGLALELATGHDGLRIERHRLGPTAPLVAGGLVLVEDPDRPFLTRSLRVPDRVAGHLLGDPRPEPRVDSLLVDVWPAPAPGLERLGRGRSGSARRWPISGNAAGPRAAAGRSPRVVRSGARRLSWISGDSPPATMRPKRARHSCARPGCVARSSSQGLSKSSRSAAPSRSGRSPKGPVRRFCSGPGVGILAGRARCRCCSMRRSSRQKNEVKPGRRPPRAGRAITRPRRSRMASIPRS